MTRLVDLDPQFVRYSEEPQEVHIATMPTASEQETSAWAAAGYPSERRTELREIHHHVQTLAEAQGIWFTCPACGNHQVAPAFAGRGVPDNLGSHNREGKPSRWTASGTGYHDLTLQPSIDLSGPPASSCQWHGFISDGEAR